MMDRANEQGVFTRHFRGVTSPQKKGNAHRTPEPGEDITQFRTLPSGRSRPPETSGSYFTPLFTSCARPFMMSDMRLLPVKKPFPRKAKSIQPGDLEAHLWDSRAKRPGESGG